MYQLLKPGSVRVCVCGFVQMCMGVQGPAEVLWETRESV